MSKGDEKPATQLISVTEAAARLSCSRGHVYDLVAAKAFRLVDIGAGKRPKSRLYADELEAFIASRTREVGGTKP